MVSDNAVPPLPFCRNLPFCMIFVIPILPHLCYNSDRVVLLGKTESEELEESMVEKETVMHALKTVIDPELGLNIVDLGLIYDITVEDSTVGVTMTLTTPGCPLHTAIARGAQTAVRKLPGVDDATVTVVWDPPWTPERLSPEARARLRWA